MQAQNLAVHVRSQLELHRPRKKRGGYTLIRTEHYSQLLWWVCSYLCWNFMVASQNGSYFLLWSLENTENGVWNS